ncbi:hypothetical protein DPMN_148993 [Dreissena polymorpha]|uniref:C2H2-type domain-containing protein n=1 Tax=Dreissena polymorpha TaxID=45954 RepID=A0A9D4J4W8_DREPO|nr:hypothetical protein DPMN_148993 [Dreissena polymorpha]
MIPSDRIWISQTSFFGFAVTEQEQESFVVSSETDRNEHNCDKCGSIFKTKRYLQEHMKAHDDPEQHPCYIGECGRAGWLAGWLAGGRNKLSHIKKQNAIKLTATLDVQGGETKKTLYDLQHFRG